MLAYSNRRGDDRALVIFHNKYANARGWMRSRPRALDKSSGKLTQHSLGEALDLPQSGLVVFKDYVTRLEYIRECAELREKGLYAELAAYQHHVFLDWRVVYGREWEAVCRTLNGAGVDSVQGMLEGMSVGAALGAETAAATVKEKKARARKKPSGARAAVKKAAPKKAVTKKVATRKPVTKKTTAKKVASKKTVVKKVSKSQGKKAPAKKAKRSTRSTA